MKELGELRSHEKELKPGGAGTVVVVLLEPLASDGKDTSGATGFDGPVISDPQGKTAQQLGAGVGSVVIVDRKGIVRWHKPGAKFKRPRVEVVAHALAAIGLAERDPKAIERARADLRSTHPGNRARGARSLGELESIADCEALERLLEDKSPEARAAAAEALAWLRDARSVEPLCKAASTGDPNAREASARALAGFGDDFDDYPGPFYRLEYTHAVNGALVAEEKAVVAAAEALLRDPKQAALRALGARLLWRLKEKAPKERLLALGKDADPEVRYAALAGLAAGFRTDPATQALARERRADGGKIAQVANYVIDGPQGKIRE